MSKVLSRNELDAAIEDLLNWEVTMSERAASPASYPENVEDSKDFHVSVTPSLQHYMTENKFQQQNEAEKERQYGNDAVKQQDFEKALMHYSRCLQLDKTSSVCWSNRALVYLKLNEYNKAKSDCIKALEYTATNIKALHRKGQAHLYLKEYGEAIASFREALKLNPHQKESESCLIEAINLLNKAAIIKWESVILTYELLTLQDRLYSPALVASDTLDAAAASPVKNEGVKPSVTILELKAKGNAEFEKGRYNSSIEWFTKSIQLAEDAGEDGEVTGFLLSSLYELRSRSWKACGRYASAISDAFKSTQLCAKNLRSHYHFANGLSNIVNVADCNRDKALETVEYLKTEYKKKGGIPCDLIKLENSLLQSRTA